MRPGGAGDDVARLDGAAVGHVLAGGHEADDVERQVELGHGLHGADDAGRAAHVELHLVHGRRVFERDAAGVEGDALADQHHGRAFGARVAVLDDEEAGRLFAALGDGEEAAHLLALDLGQAEHLHAQGFVGLGEVLRGLAEVGGRAHVAGQVGEVAHERGARGERGALREAFLDGLRGLGGRDDHHARQRMRARLLAALEIVDAIQRVAGELGHGTAEAFIGQQLGGGTRQRQRQRGDARARRGADGASTPRGARLCA